MRRFQQVTIALEKTSPRLRSSKAPNGAEVSVEREKPATTRWCVAAGIRLPDGRNAEWLGQRKVIAINDGSRLHRKGSTGRQNESVTRSKAGWLLHPVFRPSGSIRAIGALRHHALKPILHAARNRSGPGATKIRSGRRGVHVAAVKLALLDAPAAAGSLRRPYKLWVWLSNADAPLHGEDISFMAATRR